jgi:hypothetical protein
MFSGSGAFSLPPLEPYGLLPAMRAVVRKNESSRFAFFPYRKGGKPALSNIDALLSALLD